MSEKIIRTEYSEEMQRSYMDYSMSVITSRAVPDVRDGLKPVQRRVLYDMACLHLSHDKKELKSARIVGDCMGRFHPHGDSSIYETMVVMSQDFKKSIPLIDGKGNFGSVEGDGAAAYRYTEAKLRKFTDEVFLRDIDKSVPFIPAYTNTESEPEVLPVLIPNILLNGSEGIAVGMATSTPPHNLSELCDLCIYFAKTKKPILQDMMKLMPGPDFPTGGVIANREDLEEIYRTGTGKIRVRGKVKFIAGKKGEKDKLIITEIPYTMAGQGISRFMTDVIDLIESKVLSDVTDVGNATDAKGINIFLELKKDADAKKITNILFSKTKLEDTFGVNMLAISKGRPEVMSLPMILSAWLEFQHDILIRKYTKILEKEKTRYEIQGGLIAAHADLDLVLAVIRGAKNRKAAEDALTKGDISGISFKIKALEAKARKLHFSKLQANAILEMQLYKLIGLEIEELKKEAERTSRSIENCEKIISDPKKRVKMIIETVEEIKKAYPSERRTKIEDLKPAKEVTIKVKEEDQYFLMDRFGYCFLVDKTAYEKAKNQKFRFVIPTTNLDRLLFFAEDGNMHQVKCDLIQARNLRNKGTPVETLIPTAKGLELLSVFSWKNSLGGNFVFTSSDGFIKQTPVKEFDTRNRCVLAIKLKKNAKLISALFCGKKGEPDSCVLHE